MTGRDSLSGTESGKVLWSHHQPDVVSVNTGAVIVGDSVVVATGALNDNVQAFSRTDGRQLWRLRVRSTSLVSSGDVVVANTNEREGLVAIVAGTGQVRWSHSGNDAGFQRLLAAANDIAVSNTLAVNLQTGRVVARWPTLASSATFLGGPVIGTIDGDLMAYDTSYAKTWELHLVNDGDIRQLIVTDGKIVALGYSPLGGQPGEAEVAVVSERGELLWRRSFRVSTSAVAGSLSVGDDSVVLLRDAGDHDEFVLLELSTGKQIGVIRSPTRLRRDCICDNVSCLAVTVDGDVVSVTLKDRKTVVIQRPKRGPSRPGLLVGARR